MMRLSTGFPGSSPHTRGALCSSLKRQDLVGIIPAYAGSTLLLRFRLALSGDHPRIRGEHALRFLPLRAALGSSPHTRGARLYAERYRDGAGIIPAYAGSTLLSARLSPSQRDHPRIRGEHFNSAHYLRYDLGSSPHTRGAPLIVNTPAKNSGIIPAYAGSTFAKCRAERVIGDHPRIRGEHRDATGTQRGTPGSSPHTRGARPSMIPFVSMSGIIPAYAGSTVLVAKASRSHRDHPRIRGEHGLSDCIIERREGSSPHTRGAPRRIGCRTRR